MGTSYQMTYTPPMNPAMDEYDLTQTFQDLQEDLESLDALAASAQKSLKNFRVELQKHAASYQTGSLETVANILESPLATYEAIHERVESALARRADWRNMTDCIALIELKKTIYHELRALQGISAGIISSLDWQSPSYDHTFTSQAGRQTGRIFGTVNDYKRDHHVDADIYERAFIGAYVRHPFLAPARACAMVSGMATFTTIIESLRGEVGEQDIVLVGESCYFENKKVLRRVFGERIRWIPEMETEEILKAISTHHPRLIFLDTLCNTESVEMPNLDCLIPAIAKIAPATTTLILDNSALSLTCQPLSLLPSFSKLRVIVFESLNKFHQFGFDRVTGGIAWSVNLDPSKLFNTRMHFGTNIPNASVLALPKPNQTLLARRIARIGRNASFLAEALDTTIRSLKSTPLSHIAYPSLSSYTGFAWTKDKGFHGSFFILRFKPDHSRVPVYEKFLAALMREARKSGIDLNAGTSFGFDTTRAYLTAKKAEEDAKPFVRISVGTESEWEMERLTEVFEKVIEKFK